MVMVKSVHSAAYAVFLQLLVETRVKAGITQTQLAALLSFEQPSISKMEHGERRIDLIEVKQICEKLGTTLGEFVTELELRLGRAK